MTTLCADCANCFFYNDLSHCAGGDAQETLETALAYGNDSAEFKQWLVDHAIHYDLENCPDFVPTDTYDSECFDEGDDEDDGY